MPPIPGERILLNDWPFIRDGETNVQANLAIDWKFDGAAVGDIAISPAGGTVTDGRSIKVRADILPAEGSPNCAVRLVRVTTTFSKQGEADQSAVTEVTLSGEGRSSKRHVTDEAPAAAPAAPQEPAPEPAPQPQPAMA